MDDERLFCDVCHQPRQLNEVKVIPGEWFILCVHCLKHGKEEMMIAQLKFMREADARFKAICEEMESLSDD
jgi:hypothetical protein